jgi:hypothetical protein
METFMDNGFRELDHEEIDTVSGAMKWERGHVSPNVIDARGGMVTVLGYTFTFDINGKCSSVSHA